MMIAITEDGVKILCDSDNCKATADAPVALHPALSNSLSAVQPIDGWLFAASVGGVWRHYCPDCQALHLEGLREQAAY
ncbi:hypothetical protein CCAX7_41710 [Capsulimonas corticalis]|uniref:Uncharacterized protein n=1 Tax=Capsulimonas corticalis TaxID=2219043 RepID=A0A402CXZ7_9BACT|nr:hypothetical protein [Capsulimonas corticalis]BDI32120.1 hypothetical protein CCAX7_41710 [Capsulimonas corticalis]